MKMPSLFRSLALLTVAFTAVPGAVVLDDATAPTTPPAIQRFIDGGVGRMHERAPSETKQFGQLVGLWDVETEMRRQDGSWQESAPGLWAWTFALDGFAVRDLFFQAADNLPVYMADLGRDYLLSANRIFDVSSKTWQVAWMANGAGAAMGADFGYFTAVFADGEMVMTSPPEDGDYGLQRVVFHEITEDSFRWKSEYSGDDGATWTAVMRILARRRSS